MARLKQFFSNKIEILFEQLKETLYAPGRDPFARRLIIVPSQALKSWVMIGLAKDPSCGIAAGVEIVTLEKALMLLSRSFENLNLKLWTSPARFPSAFELSQLFALQIERHVQNHEISSSWESLRRFISKHPQRLYAICERLAMHFLQYGQFGCKMLKEWEQGDYEDNSWQGALWHNLKQNYPSFAFPYQLLDLLADHLSQNPAVIFSSRQWHIHLFALSFVPKRVDCFLSALASSIPVNYYLFSPCQRFWSDLCSDRESVQLQRYWQGRKASTSQLTALEELLRQRNALLSNFGRLGREMASQVEEHEADNIEYYHLPAEVLCHPDYIQLCDEECPQEKTSKPLTLLEALQADMLLLRTPSDSRKIDLTADDLSLQFHNAPTAYREVEALYYNLIGLLTKHADDSEPLTAEDIIVMAPDIRPYEPLLEAIFAAPDSLLALQCVGTHRPARSSLSQGFFHLLALAESRWETENVLSLLEYTSFQRQYNLSRSDVAQIRHWTQQCVTSWGCSTAHRQSLLQRHYAHHTLADDNPAGCWEYTLERLLLALAIDPRGLKDDHSDFAPPHDGMDISAAELLGRWVTIVERLQFSLRPIAESQELDLGEWERYFIQLLQEHFSTIEAGEEELSDFKALSQHITTIGKAGMLLGLRRVPFSALRSYLHKFLRDGVSSERSMPVRGVRYGSLYALRSVPAKVIVLIGLNEGAFPRLEPHSSLNEMRGRTDLDYAPSQSDSDRHLFLESLLSARLYFIASYVGYCFNDEKVKAPSLLLQEVCHYIDDNYTMVGKPPSQYCMINHPFDPFDESYFVEQSPQRCCYSTFQHALAQSCWCNSKSEPFQFMPTLASRPEVKMVVGSPVHQVEIRELTAVASNPLKAYFNKTLQLYINDDDTDAESCEPFHLDGLQRYKLRVKMVKEPFAKMILRASRRGLFPFGMFKKAAMDNLSDEYETMHKRFNVLEINPQTIVSLHFSESCEQPCLVANGHWQLPPLQFQSACGATVRIIGSLSDVSTQGMLVHGKLDSRHIVKAWPLWLVLQCAVAKYRLPIHAKLISTLESKVLDPFPESCDKSLQDYLTYYFSALRSPSALLPEYIDKLLQSDSSAFASAVRNSIEGLFNKSYNNYFLWLFRQQQQFQQLAPWHAAWHPTAVELFTQHLAK